MFACDIVSLSEAMNSVLVIRSRADVASLLGDEGNRLPRMAGDQMQGERLRAAVAQTLYRSAVARAEHRANPTLAHSPGLTGAAGEPTLVPQRRRPAGRGEQAEGDRRQAVQDDPRRRCRSHDKSQRIAKNLFLLSAAGGSQARIAGAVACDGGTCTQAIGEKNRIHRRLQALSGPQEAGRVWTGNEQRATGDGTARKKIDRLPPGVDGLDRRGE